jgi:hypothetical protein
VQRTAVGMVAVDAVADVPSAPQVGAGDLVPHDPGHADGTLLARLARVEHVGPGQLPPWRRWWCTRS